MLVTPFTQTGLAHGSISEQYKRKIILTTSRCFPYLNVRLPVIGQEEVVLSPIEVALEDVAKRNKQLSTAINSNPPDAKFLQMVLQVSFFSYKQSNPRCTSYSKVAIKIYTKVGDLANRGPTVLI